jgi:hypothetical protein
VGTKGADSGTAGCGLGNGWPRFDRRRDLFDLGLRMRSTSFKRNLVEKSDALFFLFYCQVFF